ncbi:ATPase [Nostoc sp. T09]|uniref:AAA family ATPase n=1 Tax=Nostoc sp. T09 TaxID=1932621 RepID=UPI000A367AFA|nr:ATP-binding protein [Nostoc sp. T09]OUL28351.1 ATPase [Nostoc sp. T09]
MTQHPPVPRLDLAPKLRRPLSLWNPLDYLRLLYWVFFFPQALRWYVDNFGGGNIADSEMNWRKGWELLRQNPIQRQLLFQGLVLTVVISVAVGLIVQIIDVPFTEIQKIKCRAIFVNFFANPSPGANDPVKVELTGKCLRWFGLIVGVSVTGGVAVGLAGGIVGGVALGVAVGVVFGMAAGVASSVAFAVVGSVVSSVAGSMTFAIAFGVVGGVAFAVVGSVAFAVVGSEVNSVAFSVVSGVVFGLLNGLVFGMAFGVAVVLVFVLVFALVFGLVFALVFSFAVLRLDNWFIGLLLYSQKIPIDSYLLLHCTPIPLSNLERRLQIWLQHDWEIALHNTNELLAYTLQFIPVLKAVNKVLARTASQEIIWRVSRLAEAPFDWNLVHFASVSLDKKPRLRAIDPLCIVPNSWWEVAQVIFITDTFLDTPARAAAAGFWHLHEKQPIIATKAFAVVRSLLYGEEMYTLAQTLAMFHEAKELGSIAGLQLPAFPQEPLLRPATWSTITSLRRVVEDVQFVNRSVSRSAKSLALNRALGELINILNQADTLPQAERGLIVDIAQTWKESLLQIAGEVGEVAITKPVINPYIVGDPVQGNLFVGREDVMRQLEELWVMGYQLQSVVLYGHRRMGKTSILVNAANSLGSGIQLVYVNLLRLGDTPQGVGEVLMAITDEISQAVKIPPPTDADLLNLPYRTFERYLKQVEAQLEGGLIIALDEFEKIEELIEAGRIPQDFIGFLRGLVQMSSKVAFAFAGLHTLEEMTADYFHPFFGSVIDIPVGFLKRAATRQILANPGEDFLLDYTPEALDEIYALTSGQPYLVQWVGFQLVRRYNDFVFEQGRSRNPVFTVEDVAAVINDSEFFKRGRYYFDGVWGQAMRGADGQQAIIQVLAPHPEGLSLDVLAESTALGSEQLQAALSMLIRHDVVAQAEGRWRIIVELFRLWVLQSHPLSGE